MRIKRMVSYIFLFLLIFICTMLTIHILKPDVLPIGRDIPAIEYLSENGVGYISHDGAKNTLVIFFKRDCKSCLYQLNLFEEHIDQYNDTKMYFLTVQNIFFQLHYKDQWPKLADHDNVTFGIVKKKDIIKKFGSAVIPYICIFNPSGQLVYKHRGEVMLKNLLMYLQ